MSSDDPMVFVASSDHKFGPKSGFCKWCYTRGYMDPVRNKHPEHTCPFKTKSLAWEAERMKRVKSTAGGGAVKALVAPVDAVPPVSSAMVVWVPTYPTLAVQAVV